MASKTLQVNQSVLRINFSLRYPLEQLGIVTIDGNIICIPTMAEKSRDSCGNWFSHSLRLSDARNHEFNDIGTEELIWQCEEDGREAGV